LNKLSFSPRRFGKTLLLAILVLILMVATTFADEMSPKTAKGDNEKVVRQVVDNWIQIATEQYKRGFYAAAEKSFLRAKDYEEYLTAAERDKLNDSLQQAHKAAVERESALAVEQPEEQLPTAPAEVKEAAEPSPGTAPAPESSTVVSSTRDAEAGDSKTLGSQSRRTPTGANRLHRGN
jgi:hypothetical protein